MDQGWHCWIRDMGQGGLCYLVSGGLVSCNCKLKRRNNQVNYSPKLLEKLHCETAIWCLRNDTYQYPQSLIYYRAGDE